MPIANAAEVEQAIRVQLGPLLGKALERLTAELVATELPNGKASTIAEDIEVRQAGPAHYQVRASIVWQWLNDGTGIYSPKHAGKGPGGRIVPLNSRALHFKNARLAAALGFPDENVFLASVRGIQPRFFWDRWYNGRRVATELAKA